MMLTANGYAAPSSKSAPRNNRSTQTAQSDAQYAIPERPPRPPDLAESKPGMAQDNSIRKILAAGAADAAIRRRTDPLGLSATPKVVTANTAPPKTPAQTATQRPKPLSAPTSDPATNPNPNPNLPNTAPETPQK